MDTAAPTRPDLRRAFSLVELLAVAAIAAILIALGFPAWTSARDAAERTMCSQNLRQIGIGLFAYAADHNNFLPAASLDGMATEDQSWGYFVWPYIYGSYAAFSYPTNCLQMGTPTYPVCPKNVFRCPATRRKPVKTPDAAGISPPRYSYGLNFGPLAPVLSGHMDLPIPLTAVPFRGRTAMVVESSQSCGDWNDFFNYNGLIPHDGGTHVLYYDGHLEWLRYALVPTAKADTFWGGQ